MTEQSAPRAQEMGVQETGAPGTSAPPGSTGEVFGAFLKLGLTSFGGPVAHLGYFRDELVLRRRWMDDAAYGDLVALCQFLPGPASSQLGFALGLLRGGGLLGGLAAWAGFTLPSAIALTACALGAASLAGTDGVLHGLKLVAVAVVAQAVWGMTRTLTRCSVLEFDDDLAGADDDTVDEVFDHFSRGQGAVFVRLFGMFAQRRDYGLFNFRCGNARD